MRCFSRATRCIVLAAALLAAGPARADYPDRAVTLVVPFAAGGPVDIAARSLADAMVGPLGQTIVVANKGGAGGSIGTAHVANSAPDGYTVLMMHVGFTTAPSLYKNPGYDPYTSFQPIGMSIEVPMTLIARSDFPADNIQELLEYFKTHKDTVALGNAGVGSASHLCDIMLMNALGVDLLTVPYKGTGPAMNDLLGKRLDVICDQSTNTTQYIKGGMVKAYAVTSQQRVPALPDLPTLREAGLPDLELGIWFGLWAPKGTPQPAVDTLSAALRAALADPDFQRRMAAMGANTLPVSMANPQTLARKVEQQVPFWNDLFRKSGIEP